MGVYTANSFPFASCAARGHVPMLYLRWCEGQQACSRQSKGQDTASNEAFNIAYRLLDLKYNSFSKAETVNNGAEVNSLSSEVEKQSDHVVT